MKSTTYRLLQRLSTKVVNDIGRLQWAVAQVGAWALAKVDQQRLLHEVALLEQANELTELKLLSSTLEIKDIALRSGGFDIEHGPALAIAANALVDHCGWEDDDVTSWFGTLVMDEEGVNLGADIVLEDEDFEDEDE